MPCCKHARWRFVQDHLVVNAQLYCGFQRALCLIVLFLRILTGINFNNKKKVVRTHNQMILVDIHEQRVHVLTTNDDLELAIVSKLVCGFDFWDDLGQDGLISVG
jgi:hypothetical protein